ncbi:MAG: hypothetical protein RDU14_00445 [Melioribacteraceae bacterium]|nr:hypothetical protein [Melioribacteraceae bacterium]
MKNFIRIFFFILNSAVVIYSQTAAATIMSKSDSLRNEGEILKSIEECKNVFFRNPKDIRNLYNYSRFLSINKQIDSCFKYLKIAAEIDTSITPLIEPDLLTARESEQWNDFENRLISNLNIKFKNAVKDFDYAKVLWKLRAFDQAYFLETEIAGRKLGFKSSVVEALWKLKFMIQEKSQKELVEWIDKKGWPRIKNVGREAAFTAWLVIMHSNVRLQKKYLPVIKKICEGNELPWARYAAIYDRSLFNDNKPQKYGTHITYNERTGSMELYPLENESMVDVWRKEVGLQPLEEYLKQNNIPSKTKMNNQ